MFLETLRQIPNENLNFLIPGGPGLSPRTLANLEQNFNGYSLVRFWPPGSANFVEPNFDPELSQEACYSIVLEEAINAIKLIPNKTRFNFIGHGFGGKIAIDLARAFPDLTSNVVLITSPFTVALENALLQKIEDHADESFRLARKAYDRKPTRDTYRKLSCEYAKFCEKDLEVRQRIHEILLSDESSPLALARWNKRQAFDSEVENDIETLRNCRKIAIFGTDDGLIDIDLASSESERLGFDFFPLNGGHFPFLDGGAQALASLLEIEFLLPF